jgi:hypothetical protein
MRDVDFRVRHAYWAVIDRFERLIAAETHAAVVSARNSVGQLLRHARPVPVRSK